VVVVVVASCRPTLQGRRGDRTTDQVDRIKTNGVMQLGGGREREDRSFHHQCHFLIITIFGMIIVIIIIIITTIIVIITIIIIFGMIISIITGIIIIIIITIITIIITIITVIITSIIIIGMIIIAKEGYEERKEGRTDIVTCPLCTCWGGYWPSVGDINCPP
jgi:hypothetical protein